VTEATLTGNPLRESKASPNVHLDWTAFAGGSNIYVVRRKERNPSDKTFNGSSVIGGVSNATPSAHFFDDAVLADGKNYDYKVLLTSANDTLYFYHTDHLGTPIAMTDGSSMFRWRAELRPFGDVQSLSSTIENNLRFPGQYFDSETGLHQNWFRDYAPKTGRYLEADPIGLSGGINLYAYSGDSPVAFADPTGLAFCLYDISLHRLTCTTNDFSRTTTIGPENVFSGFGECANNPLCAEEENTGPVPPGNYDLIATEKYGGSWFLKQAWLGACPSNRTAL